MKGDLAAIIHRGIYGKSDKVSDEIRLAFEVDIHSMRCVVFASTAAKARWQAVKGFWEAGYGRKGTWPNPKAVRTPRLDASPLRDREQRAWVPEYAESTVS